MNKYYIAHYSPAGVQEVKFTPEGYRLMSSEGTGTAFHTFEGALEGMERLEREGLNRRSLTIVNIRQVDL